MTGSWRFESIPVKELESFEGPLLSRIPLRMVTKTVTGSLQKTWGSEAEIKNLKHRIIGFLSAPASLFEQGTIKTSAIKHNALPWFQNFLKVSASCLLPSACLHAEHDSHPFCSTMRPSETKRFCSLPR